MTENPVPVSAPAAVPAAAGEVKCAECGKPANVNFTPDPSRPVFCGDCFQKRRASSGPGGPRGGPRGGGFGGRRDGPFRPREARVKGVGSHGFSRYDYPGSK